MVDMPLDPTKRSITRGKDLSMSYYLLIVREGLLGFISFLKISPICEMKVTSGHW